LADQSDEKKVSDAYKQILPVIEEWVRFTGYYHEVPGVSMAIQQHNELLTAKAFGKSNLETKEKLTSETRFRIASHSKMFTATAIMELYATEKLSLDDKVTKYIDWFKPNEGNIRIKHLLTHSSGITRDAEFGQWYHHKFPDLNQFKKIMTEKFEILDPAVQIKYSNIAYTLLGQIIEIVSGISYTEYMRDLIQRLGLVHTSSKIGETAKLHSLGYSIRMPGEERKSFPHVEAKVMDAATGFSSTPIDILKFYQAQMIGQDKGLQYGDYFKREMQNLQFKYKETEWGLGFMRVRPHNTLFLGHGGGYPGFISFSAFNPDKELGIAVFTNTLSPPELVIGMVGLIQFAEKNFKKYEDEERDFSLYEGIYRSHWVIMYIKQFNQQLLLLPLNVADPSIDVQRLKYVEEGVFVAEDAPPFAGKGERVYFKDGKVEMRGSVYQKFKYDY